MRFHLSAETLHDATQAQSLSWFIYPSDEAVVLVAVSAFLLCAVGGFIGGAVMPYFGDAPREE